MEKSAYVFKLKDVLTLDDCMKIYSIMQSVLNLNCNKYTLVFQNGDKTTSRSGKVKNLEKNCLQYKYSLRGSPALIEIFNQPEGIERWELDKIGEGFYIDRCVVTQKWNIYIILPYKLPPDTFIDLWNTIYEHFSMTYALSFSLGVSKKMEIFMYGIPFIPLDYDFQSYYTEEEKAQVQKLNALKLEKTSDLGNCFTQCIVTEGASCSLEEYKTTPISNGLFCQKITDTNDSTYRNKQ